MTLTDEEIQKLRGLPGGVFRVVHVRAIAGDSNQPPRRVCVHPKDGSGARWHDEADDIVRIDEGDAIELVPHANIGSVTHGPNCTCPDCARSL